MTYRPTGKIHESKVTDQWLLPKLSPGGAGRILTKHFTNLSFTLHKDQLALISFLIYQSEYDNTVKYSINLLTKFDNSVTRAQELYGKSQYISRSIPTARRNFRYLVNRGLLLPTEKKNIFLIHPHLTYSKTYVQYSFYQSWDGSTQEYINHVNSRK